MNSLKGLGIFAVMAGIVWAVSLVASSDTLMVAFAILVIAVSLFLYTAALRRRRMDRRVANGRVRSGGVTPG